MTAPIPAKPRSTSHPSSRNGLALAISAALILVGLAWWFSREEKPDAPDQSIALAPSTSETPGEKRADDPEGITNPDPEKTAPGTPRHGVDASNFYKNAFVLYAALTQEEKDMLRQPAGQLDPQKAEALFSKIRPILDLLRQAAEADYCEWGLSELPPGTLPPQLNSARDLGRVATWSADYRFHLDVSSDLNTDSFPREAFTDLRAQAKFADNLSEALIGWFLQTAMEVDANAILRRHAMEFDDESFAQAQEFMDASTVRENAARAFNAEGSNAEKIAEKLANPSPAEKRRHLQSLGMLKDPSAAPAPAEMDTDGQEAAGTPLDEAQLAAWMRAEAQYLGKISRQAAEAVFWPTEQFDAWRAGVQAELEKHPMAAVQINMVKESRRRLDQIQVEHALLSAGLALAQDGPETLAQIPDPASGKPFTYVTKEGGFELQSIFQVRGKPLTMTFARPQ
jgi:hypothetical protein